MGMSMRRMLKSCLVRRHLSKTVSQHSPELLHWTNSRCGNAELLELGYIYCNARQAQVALAGLVQIAEKMEEVGAQALEELTEEKEENQEGRREEEKKEEEEKEKEKTKEKEKEEENEQEKRRKR